MKSTTLLLLDRLRQLKITAYFSNRGLERRLALFARSIFSSPYSSKLASFFSCLPTGHAYAAVTHFLLGYLLSLKRAARSPGAGRIALFVSGWAVLAASLVGPIEHWAHVSLAGHMLQHMVLLAVAPPLVLLARPMPQYMLALPTALRRRIGPHLERIYGGTAATPITAFLVHGLVIWIWQLPLPFQIVLHHPLLHDAVHLLFFGTGLWFWWSLIAPGRLGQGGFGSAAGLSVLTMMQMGMLGALLTFAPQLLYPEPPGRLRRLQPALRPAAFGPVDVGVRRPGLYRGGTVTDGHMAKAQRLERAG